MGKGKGYFKLIQNYIYIWLLLLFKESVILVNQSCDLNNSYTDRQVKLIYWFRILAFYVTSLFPERSRVIIMTCRGVCNQKEWLFTFINPKMGKKIKILALCLEFKF